MQSNQEDAIMRKTETVVVANGSNYRVRDGADMQVYDTLPVGTYTVGFDQRAEEFFLSRIPDFELPKKIYGRNTRYAERILNTFDQRPLSTGVLLSGIKGAGKTLLAKQVSILAQEKGIPTIVINKDWHGDQFNSFIQSLQGAAIIMFDEFEKVYGWAEQRKILTLLDGVFPTKKLFLLTTNTEREVSEFLRNRPGRIYYSLSFETLGQDFIREYLEDRLDDKSKIESVLTYTKVFSFFNFDMLVAAVEEMNRYGETLAEVLEILNIVPENVSTDTYTVVVLMNGAAIVMDKNYRGFQPNQFQYEVWSDDEAVEALKGRDSKLHSELMSVATTDPDYPADDKHIQFTHADIKEFDANTNTFTYEVSRAGQTVQLQVKRNDTVEKWKYTEHTF